MIISNSWPCTARKNSLVKVLMTRMERKALEEFAERNGRTLSWVVRAAIRREISANCDAKEVKP